MRNFGDLLDLSICNHQDVIAQAMNTRSRKRPKISVLLNADEAVRFEAYCDERGHKKSTLIARLIREHLQRERFQMQPEFFRQMPAETDHQ